MAKPGSYAAVIDAREKQPAVVQLITALPQPLLELILIQGTDEQDKKALRQTCKSFQQILDRSLVCTKVLCNEFVDLQNLRHLFKHTHNLRSLHTVVCPGADPEIGRMFRQLPATLTTFKFECLNDAVCAINLKDLMRLPRLASLHVSSSTGRASFTGMEHISGLTSLHCDRYVGSLAHLAPTLKHLSIKDLRHVHGMNKLKNLELLKMSGNLSYICLKTIIQIPLKHLWLTPGCGEYWDHFHALESAPTTLTRLTLEGSEECMSLAGLPKSITLLQLLNAPGDKIQLVSSGLPWLRRLDVSMYMYRCETAFSHLTDITNLHSLGISIQKGTDVYMGREQALSVIPSVAKAVSRGVKLSVHAGTHEMLVDASNTTSFRSSWVTHI